MNKRIWKSIPKTKAITHYDRCPSLATESYSFKLELCQENYCCEDIELGRKDRRFCYKVLENESIKHTNPSEFKTCYYCWFSWAIEKGGDIDKYLGIPEKKETEQTTFL